MEKETGWRGKREKYDHLERENDPSKAMWWPSSLVQAGFLETYK